MYEPTKALLEKTFSLEKEKFNELKKSVSKYHDALNLTDKSKQKFYTSATAGERLMISVLQMKVKGVSVTPDIEATYKKAKGFLIEAQEYERTYIANIEKANALRMDSIEKQRIFHETLQSIEMEVNSNIAMVISLYIASIKKMVSTVLLDLDVLSDNYKNLNIEGDMDAFVSSNKSNNIPDREILFEPYKPLTPINDKVENLTLNYEVLKEIKSSFKDVLPEYDLKKEALKKEIRDLCNRVFKSNKEFDKEDLDKLLQYVKEKESRRTFLYTLNKQRTSGQFNRSERIMNYLSELVTTILDVSEKEKDYDSARNCIILSQTFYIDDKKDKNGEKHYLFERIVKNKWLTSVEFWYGIIDRMIEQELDKNETSNKEINANETEEERKRRLSNIAFSQVLPYTNNMLDFKIDKKIVVQLVDKYVKQYGIDQQLAEAIYGNVNEKKY